METKQKRLWEDFINENPSNRELFCVAENHHGYLRGQAVETLLDRNLSEEELCQIMKKYVLSGEENTAIAKRIFSSERQSNETLKLIVAEISDGKKNKAFCDEVVTKLFNQDKSKKSLVTILQWSSLEDIANQAWEKLKKQEIDEETMEDFFSEDHISRWHTEEIFTKFLLKSNLSEEHLWNIAEWSESNETINSVAIKLFEKNPPEGRDLILEFANEYCHLFIPIVEDFLSKVHKDNTFSEEDNHKLCKIICKISSKELRSRIWKRIGNFSISLGEVKKIIQYVEELRGELWPRFLNVAETIEDIREMVKFMEPSEEGQKKVLKVCEKILALKDEK